MALCAGLKADHPPPRPALPGHHGLLGKVEKFMASCAHGHCLSVEAPAKVTFAHCLRLEEP